MKDEHYYEHHPIGKLTIKLDMLKHAYRHVWPERFWRWLSFRLPRDLVLWALVRATIHAMGKHESPDQMTYPVIHDRWIGHGDDEPVL